MLSTWELGVLSQAFSLAPRQIRQDVASITVAREPLDEIIATLRERHNWSSADAYKYLRTLLTAQRGGPISL